MNEELLTKLVDTLEDINTNLSDIAASLKGIDRNINDCMCVYGNNQFLRITGNVITN